MKHTRKHITLTVTFLLGWLVSVAQGDPMPLSLEDAIKYSLQNNDSIKNARLDVLIQKAKNAEITGIALPQISGSGQGIAYPQVVQSFVPGEFIGAPAGTFIAVPFTPRFGNTLSLSASQILFDGSVLVALQARKAIIELAEEGANLTEENMRYSVSQAYYSLVVAQRQFEILKSSLGIFRGLLNDTRATYKEGLIEKIDVDRTTVAVNNLATDSLRVSSLLAVSEQLLKYRMGMDINQPVVLTDTSLAKTVATAQSLLTTDLDYQNITLYRFLEKQLTLNEFDLKRHRFSALPSLAAFGGYTHTYATNTFSDLFRNNYINYSNVGLQLNVPIFDGNQRRNRVKQARFEIEKTKNTMHSVRLGLDFQTSTTRTLLKNSLLALQSQEANLGLAFSVFDLAQRKYKEGVGSSIEVSQAQTDYLNAQNNYFQTLLEVNNTGTDLQRSLGLLRQQRQ